MRTQDGPLVDMTSVNFNYRVMGLRQGRKEVEESKGRRTEEATA